MTPPQRCVALRPKIAVGRLANEPTKIFAIPPRTVSSLASGVGHFPWPVMCLAIAMIYMRESANRRLLASTRLGTVVGETTNESGRSWAVRWP